MPPAQVVTLAGLRERHLGVLEGLKRKEAPALQPAAYRAFVSKDQHVEIEVTEVDSARVVTRGRMVAGSLDGRGGEGSLL